MKERARDAGMSSSKRRGYLNAYTAGGQMDCRKMAAERGKDLSIKEENKKKKEHLRKYRMTGRRIRRIKAEIEEIKSMQMYPSINNDGMPRGTTQNDLSNYAAEIAEKEEELYNEGVDQVRQYKDISAKINSIENQDERDVLFYRYIKGMTFWEIAQEMDYSESGIYKLHGRALENIKEI